jgi:hypothetical protein
MKATTQIFIGCIGLMALAFCVTAQPKPDTDLIKRRIAQLHDADYAKRNAAVQVLASEPTTAEVALPLLKQELKRETDPNRCWWIKSAIQHCEENLPQPDEIFTSPDNSQGIRMNEPCKNADGPYVVVEHAGIRCWEMPKHEGNAWSYLYFIADDAFRQKAGTELVIELYYLDAGTGDFGLDYDSTDPQAPSNGAYENHSLKVNRLNTGQWRKVRFNITNARFRGSENCGSDFRFYNHGGSLLISFIRVWPVKV